VSIAILEIVGQPWLVLESFIIGSSQRSHRCCHGGHNKGEVSHG